MEKEFTNEEAQQIVNDLMSPEFANTVAQNIHALGMSREQYRKQLQDNMRMLSHPVNYFRGWGVERITSAVTQVLRKNSTLPSTIRQFIMDMATHTLEDLKKKREDEAIAKENIKSGDDFFNSLDDSYETIEGIKVKKINHPSDGITVLEENDVTLCYEGKLIDGTVFDSNDNATFKPTQVVPGFKAGLLSSVEGGEYEYIIPSSLGYGNNSIGSIPPGSTLIFHVLVKKVL